MPTVGILLLSRVDTTKAAAAVSPKLWAEIEQYFTTKHHHETGHKKQCKKALHQPFVQILSCCLRSARSTSPSSQSTFIVHATTQDIKNNARYETGKTPP